MRMTMASRRKHDNDASSSGPPTKSELLSKNTRQIAFNRGQGVRFKHTPRENQSVDSLVQVAHQHTELLCMNEASGH